MYDYDNSASSVVRSVLINSLFSSITNQYYVKSSLWIALNHFVNVFHQKAMEFET